MNKTVLSVLAASLIATSTVLGQLDELQILPRDIKVVPPSIINSRETRDYGAVAQAREEVLKLLGDCKLVPGEVVMFSYGWPINATLKSDPTKVMQNSYLRSHAFILSGGDGQHTAELMMPSSGQIVVLQHPAQANAPVHSLVTLVVPKSIVGMSKEAVQNRLSSPSKTEKSTDGKEQWHFHHELTERGYTTQKSTSTTTGVIGNDIVSFNTTQSTPIALKRTLVLWDFKLIFNDKGAVERLEQGEIGAGEWKQVGP